MAFKIGDQVRWARDDPLHGRYAVPERFRNIVGVVVGFSDRNSLCIDYDNYDGKGWYLLPTMVEHLEGPW